MRNIFGAATFIACIAVAIVLMFLAPKGFMLSDPSPIVSTAAGQ